MTPASRVASARDGVANSRVYLKEFRESALGHAILEGEVPPEMERLGLDRVAGAVRKVLERILPPLGCVAEARWCPEGP